eukprot:m.358087 g.358087  ORF g.358087 m.358087 type:complete len:246 (-) comp18032_c0_seq1:143-880(-)
MADDGTVPQESVTIRAVYNKVTHEVTVSKGATVGDLKVLVAAKTECPMGQMKLMFKGLLAGPSKPELDEVLISDTKLKDKAKVLVVGASASQILEATEVASMAASGIFKAEEAASTLQAKKKWADMREHQLIIKKGVPDDAMLGYVPGQDPLPDGALTGLVTSGNVKVRLQIKPVERMVVISTKERTQKIPLSKVQAVKTEPIPNFEHYHIVGLQVGPTSRSMIYLYWMPAQLISALKGAFLGVF